MLGKEEYYLNEQQALWRSLWFAHNVAKQLYEILWVQSGSFLLEDMLDDKKVERHFQETATYTGSLFLEKLADDLQERYGWSDRELDLCEEWMVNLACAFDNVYGYSKRNMEVFLNLFRQYWTPKDYSDEAYDIFWGIPEDEEPTSVEKALQQLQEEIHKDAKDIEKDYNIHRLYTFRISKIYNIPEPRKFLDMWKKRCSDIAMPLYKKVFVDLSLHRIKKDFKSGELEPL